MFFSAPVLLPNNHHVVATSRSHLYRHQHKFNPKRLPPSLSSQLRFKASIRVTTMAQPEKKAQLETTLTREEYTQLWKDSRLSIPPLVRIPAAALTAFGIGMTLGLAHGSKMAGLRFRAEHAHRLPTTTTGWYLYHKSKNYHLAFGGLKEGVKVGARLSVLSTAMFCAENLFDVYRGTKDLLNTVMASLAIAGGFSLWNGFSAAETARTARKGLKFGLVYGGIQDVISMAKGRPVGYVDFIRKHIGKPTQLHDKAV